MIAVSLKTGAEKLDAGDAETALRPAKQSPSGWSYQLAVLRHYKAVYGYAAAIVGAGADAEDVTQETFLRYGQRGGNVQRTREWLLRVARNLCFDRFRSASRLTSLEPETVESMYADDEPARQFERGEIESRLRRVIATLPEPQRSLVILFDMQGMSGDECGRILELSGNQVKVYLHRARRRLREILEQSNG